MYGRVSVGSLVAYIVVVELRFKYCSLGEGCSHVAAILFKVESAVRNGYTSSTSNSCQWNQVFSTKVRLLVDHLFEG